jgi:hypothetical protein
MIAVATECPLSGQLHLRHRVDHAICVRNVFGVTVFRLRISRFHMRRSTPSVAHVRMARRVFRMARTGMQLCERLNLFNQATIVGV